MGFLDKYKIEEKEEEEKEFSFLNKYKSTPEVIKPTQFGIGAKAEMGITLPETKPSILTTSPTTMGVLGISEPLDLDKINKYVAAPLKGISHGIYSSPQAIGGLMRNLGEVSQELKTAPKIFMGDDEKYKELIENKSKAPEIEMDKIIANKGQEIIKQNRELLEAKRLYTKGEDKVEDFLFNLGSGATSLVGAIGISMLTGSPHAAAIAFGLYQKGTLYQEAREAGVAVRKAGALSTVGGVIEGALEYIGLELLFSKMGGGALVNTIMHAGTEGMQEFSQTLGENIIAKIGWDGQRDLLQGTGESALIGALLGAPASIITSNAEKSVKLQNITEQKKHQLITNIINKQLGAIGVTLQNLNVNTIMEKVKTDPDIQKAIAGVLQGEVFEPVVLGKEAEEPIPKKPELKPEVKPEVEIEKEIEFPKDIKIREVYPIGELLPKAKIKGKIREITGQTKGEKILAYESDILKYALKGQVKAARKAFRTGKEKGIFDTKEKYEERLAKAKVRKYQKDYINKLIKDINKLPTKNMAVDYKEMIEDIQGEFDLKKRTAKTLYKRQRLAHYIEKQAELDYEVDIPQDQIDLIRKKPLNEMTIEELETVHDNIMHLAHLGKTKGKLLKIAEKRSLQKQTDNLIDTITKGIGIEIKDVIRTGKEDRTFFQKVKEVGQIYHYNTIRAERLFEQADNYKDNGEFWKTFFKPINEATYEEKDNYNEKLDDFRTIIKNNNIDIGKFLVDKHDINDRVMLTSAEKVEVFMATFDKDKMRHLIRGNNFKEKDVTDVINSLTPEEKAMGNFLIKHYEEQYKGINDIYKKLTGKNLPKIPGYSPIRLLSETIDTTKDVIESLLTKYNVRPSVRKGFTKERTRGAIQPLHLDAVNNFMFNLSRVEHYKAFVLPIRDINKLLSNPKLIEAIRQKKGNPFYQNLKSWLLDVSDTNPGISFDQVDKIARILRTRAADAMLGFNIVSAMKQPISVLNACAEIGISNVLNGIQQLTKSPITTTRIVYSKSSLVRNRKGQFDRVIGELEKSKTIKQIIKQTKTKSDIIIGLLKFMDQQSIKAVWKGAYDQGLGKGMAEQEAIDYADKVIRKTQPMAGVKDLAKWFRGGTLSKMFTMFQNQINNNYNYYTHDIIGKYRAGEIGVGKVMYRVAFSYIMPALLIGMVSRGRLPKDKEVLKDLISFPIAGLFFVGAIVRNMIQGWDEFSIPPLSWANDVIKAGTMKKISTRIKYSLSALAKLLGIPWNQPYRTVKGMIDYLGGATDDLRRLIWSEYALGKEEKEKSVSPYLDRYKKIIKPTTSPYLQKYKR